MQVVQLDENSVSCRQIDQNVFELCANENIKFYGEYVIYIITNLKIILEKNKLLLVVQNEKYDTLVTNYFFKFFKEINSESNFLENLQVCVFNTQWNDDDYIKKGDCFAKLYLLNNFNKKTK